MFFCAAHTRACTTGRFLWRQGCLFVRRYILPGTPFSILWCDRSGTWVLLIPPPPSPPPPPIAAAASFSGRLARLPHRHVQLSRSRLTGGVAVPGKFNHTRTFAFWYPLRGQHKNENDVTKTPTPPSPPPPVLPSRCLKVGLTRRDAYVYTPVAGNGCDQG